jgi:hypothetical protein
VVVKLTTTDGKAYDTYFGSPHRCRKLQRNQIVIYKQNGGNNMSVITDKMMNIAEEAMQAAQTDDYSLEDENALLVKINRTLLEAHSSAIDMVNQYVDAFKAQKEEFHKLADAYKELQKKYDQTPELVFMSLSLDPAGTLQDFLKHMERQAKIEDQSGDSWRWKFQLTFKHRLKIALKLLTGPVV